MKMKMKKNKKVVYTTTVNIDDGSAQSKQIRQMSNAFYNVMGKEFALICFSNDGRCDHEFIKTFKSSKKKWIKTLFLFLHIVINYKNDQIFTRDLVLACLFSLMGKKVIWEAHQKVSLRSEFILRFLNYLPKFKVLSISESLKKLGNLKINDNKIFVYHDGVNLDEVKAAKKYETNNLRKQALYTGALHKGKDIESVSPLFSTYKDWDFIFIGGKCPEVKKYSAKYKHFENVFFLGSMDYLDVLSRQQAADVLIYPLTKSNQLWRYTSPLKLFEYMAAKKPIVASNIGAVSEILSSNNAFVFNEKISIDDAFRNYLEANQTKIEKMINLNYELLQNKYNWSARVTYIIEKIFEEEVKC